MKAFHEIRRYQSGFKVFYCKYRNMSFSTHWHSEIELIYVRDGKAAITIGETEYAAESGDLLICASEDVHYSDSYLMDNLLEFILFDPKVISFDSYDNRTKSCLLSAERLKSIGLDSLTEKVFDTVSAEMKLQRSRYREIVRNLIGVLWFSLQRFCITGTEAPLCDHSAVKASEHIKEVLKFIDENYSEVITLKDAALVLNLSPCYFSTLFKKYTGTTFQNYLEYIRIEKAANMLNGNPSLRIIDISFQCGYYNVRSFNRAFKKITSVTPTEWRNSTSLDQKHVLISRSYSCNTNVENDSVVVQNNLKPLADL